MPTSATRKTPAKKPAVRRAPATPAALQPTPAADWKKKSTFMLELPSGKVAEILHLDLTTLIAEGLLGDSLTGMALAAVDKGQGMSDTEIRKMGQDPKQINEALEAMDKVAVRAFYNPKLTYCKLRGLDANGEEVMLVIPEDDRDPELLYSDEVDMTDKSFLFNVIGGGSTDLDRFRLQLEQSVAGVPAGQGVAGQTV